MHKYLILLLFRRWEARSDHCRASNDACDAGIENCPRRKIDMPINSRLRNAIALATLCGFILVLTPAAHAGPCTAQIRNLEQQIKLSASNPAVGPSGTQTVGAQLHHQPTPTTVEHAEIKANADADAALDRARKADAAGDALGCHSALVEARRLYGLEK
jgi:hypothetical protein